MGAEPKQGEMEMSKFIESANSRETSPEIMEACLWLARDDEDAAVRIWEDPTEPELLAIWERVTNNGLIPSEDFCFGAAGSQWAPSGE